MTARILSAGAQGETTSTTAVALIPRTTTSGSVFVAFCHWDTQAFTSIADTINGAASGNTWTLLNTELTGGSSLSRTYYTSAGFNGGINHRFTLTIGSGDFISILVLELDRIDTASIINGSTRLRDAASPYDSGGVTTTRANCFLVGPSGSEAGSGTAVMTIDGSATPSTGWKQPNALTNAANFQCGAMFGVPVEATGTYNCATVQTAGTAAHQWIVALNGIGPAFPTNIAESATKNVGETQALTVVTTASSGSVTYQWQISENLGAFVNVSDGSGGTTDSYTTRALTISDNNVVYRCAATDSTGVCYSAEQVIKVAANSPTWAHAA